tara:strand:+ start:220 stop:510 length:291 start_codon:yes stop_codon:yes gene_type:complete
MSNLGKLFDKTGSYSAESLNKKKKKKKKPAPTKPTPPVTKSKKKDKPKRKITGQQWKDAGEALTKSAKNLGKTASDERAKTQALKDQLYIRRNKKK